MDARLVLLALIHAWRYVGAALLSAALSLPAAAGTNEWTTLGLGTCGTDGVPSKAAMLACHEAFFTVTPPFVQCGAAFFNYGPDTSDETPPIVYWAHTRLQFDDSAPYDCGTLTNSNSLNWIFEETCAGGWVATPADRARFLGLAQVGLGIGRQVVDELPGDGAAALETAQEVGHEVGVALDVRELGQHGGGAARAEHRGLVRADLREDPLVALLTQAGTRAEVVQDQRRTGADVGGDGAE